MITSEKYEESLRRMHRAVYMFGRRVADPADDPILRPSLMAVAETYAMAARPEHKTVMTAVSHLSGHSINRFTHIHRDTADLMAKTRMGRLMGARTGCCFQRCVGTDALNALSITTYNIDARHGTSYFERFNRYLAHVQDQDLVCDGAMTDPKGDRSLAPHEQPDPDMYLRIVQKRDDGIVVRGAKAHQTGAVNSHEIIALPTVSMKEADRDYAIAFAVPADSTGLTYIVGRQSSDTRKCEEGSLDVGNPLYGGHEALIVFDDVFVPWDRVFMCGEYEFAGELVEKFAAYHRHSYACKVGVGDVLIGATQLIAEMNGVQRAAHVRDKIIEMNHLNETMFCGSLACAAEGRPERSGTFSVDTLLANVSKQNVTRFPYEIARLAQDIAGGLLVTLPSAADFASAETGPWMHKYFQAQANEPAESRRRVLRLIENLTQGAAAVGYLTESMHGAGSPQAQRIMISRLVDLDAKKKLAKRLCDLDDVGETNGRVERIEAPLKG